MVTMSIAATMMYRSIVDHGTSDMYGILFIIVSFITLALPGRSSRTSSRKVSVLYQRGSALDPLASLSPRCISCRIRKSTSVRCPVCRSPTWTWVANSDLTREIGLPTAGDVAWGNSAHRCKLVTGHFMPYFHMWCYSPSRICSLSIARGKGRRATWLACEVTAVAKFRNLTYPPSPASAKQGHAVSESEVHARAGKESINKSRPDQTPQVRRIVVSLPLVTTKTCTSPAVL